MDRRFVEDSLLWRFPYEVFTASAPGFFSREGGYWQYSYDQSMYDLLGFAEYNGVARWSPHYLYDGRRGGVVGLSRTDGVGVATGSRVPADVAPQTEAEESPVGEGLIPKEAEIAPDTPEPDMNRVSSAVSKATQAREAPPLRDSGKQRFIVTSIDVLAAPKGSNTAQNADVRNHPIPTWTSVHGMPTSALAAAEGAQDSVMSVTCEVGREHFVVSFLDAFGGAAAVKAADNDGWPSEYESARALRIVNSGFRGATLPEFLLSDITGTTRIPLEWRICTLESFLSGFRPATQAHMDIAVVGRIHIQADDTRRDANIKRIANGYSGGVVPLELLSTFASSEDGSMHMRPFLVHSVTDDEGRVFKLDVPVVLWRPVSDCDDDGVGCFVQYSANYPYETRMERTGAIRIHAPLEEPIPLNPKYLEIASVIITAVCCLLIAAILALLVYLVVYSVRSALHAIP